FTPSRPENPPHAGQMPPSPLLLRRSIHLRRLRARRARLAGLRRILRGRRGTLLYEQLDRLLAGDRLGRQVARQGPVGDPVGDVRAEPALLDHDRLLGGRVVAQLTQRRRRGGTAAALGLRVDRQRLLERRREEGLLGGER